MQEKKDLKIIKAESENDREYMRQNAQKLKAELKKSSADDVINPEIYRYLSEKQARQLRRWVNQFIKANAEKSDADSDAIIYPFMNAKLRRAIAGVVEKMKDIEIKKQCEALKVQKEALLNKVAENED